jgi:uncharacterized membrane protein YsdA (DUF1294 family)
MGWVGWALAWYGVASVVAFVGFAVDKRAARGGRVGGRRIRERTLHGLEAVGGWPGALVAMVVLRHKNRKVGFVVVTCVIAAVHVGAWVVLGLRGLVR